MLDTVSEKVVSSVFPGAALSLRLDGLCSKTQAKVFLLGSGGGLCYLWKDNLLSSGGIPDLAVFVDVRYTWLRNYLALFFFFFFPVSSYAIVHSEELLYIERLAAHPRR